MNDNDIRALFKDHGVPLSKDDVWKTQGVSVIKHAALERLAAEIGIKFDDPVVLRCERDEAVFLVRGTRKDGISDWAVGEALISRDGQPGGNYKVSGKQASYVYAMSSKRARDRVTIALAGLHGAYSEDEADDFKQGSRPSRDQVDPDTGEVTEAAPPKDNVVAIKPVKDDAPASAAANDVKISEDVLEALEKALVDAIDGCQTTNSVADFMLHADTQADLKRLGSDGTDRVRDHAKKRLKDLGWPGKKAS